MTIEAQKYFIESWIERHGQNYVSHAIWPDNVEEVLKKGKITPAEALLRTTGKVEYEAGTLFGSRGTKGLIALNPDQIAAFEVLEPEEEEELQSLQKRLEKEKLEVTKEEYVEYKKLQNKIDNSKIDLNDIEILIEWGDLCMSLKNPTLKSDSYGRAQKRLEEFEKKEILPSKLSTLSAEETSRWSLLQAKFLLNPLDRNRLKALKNKKIGFYFQFTKANKSVFCNQLNNDFRDNKIFHSLGSKVDISIAIDELKGRILDRTLSAKFKKWTAQGFERKSLIEACFMARMYTIGCSKLNAEIRTTKNSVAWAYGEVAVITGDPDAIIHSPVKARQEALLLPPWQNGGEPFCLSLSRPNTFLLGPTALLSKVSYPCVYTESLTPEQKNLFNLPVS